MFKGLRLPWRTSLASDWDTGNYICPFRDLRNVKSVRLTSFVNDRDRPYRYLKPFLCQVMLCKSLPLAHVILGLREAQLGWGRRNAIQMLTFRQLILQFFHHSLERKKNHSSPPQFIQDQAPIHCPVINFFLAVIIHEKFISNASRN